MKIKTTMPRQLLIYMLFFSSGFGGLVYEVLWMKELGLLFGNTSYATSATLAAFFLGIAGGGLFLGRFAKDSKNPLRLYAALEIAVNVVAKLKTNQWFTSDRLIDFYDLVLDISPPANDPYLDGIKLD